jgi:hypothetical protein
MMVIGRLGKSCACADVATSERPSPHFSQC